MLITAEHHPAKFKEGEIISVIRKFPIVHYRTPTYVRGKQGIIIKNLGKYIPPETEAFGKNAGNKMWHYMVRFLQKDLWRNYEGQETMYGN